MINIIISHNNMNHSSVKPQTETDIPMAGDIVTHYCLWFDRGVVHIVVIAYIVDH
jgi:hypothetical protein